MDLASIAEKFGFPVLCVFACGWFIRWLVMDRIKALESAIKAGLQREVDERAAHLQAQRDRVRAADAFAAAMRDLAERTTRALERNTAVAEKNQDVLARLMDHLSARPCLSERPEPRPQTLHQGGAPAIEPRPPSSDDLPAIDPPTDQHDAVQRRFRMPR